MSAYGIYKAVVRSTADPLGSGRIKAQVAQTTGTAMTGWVPPAQAGGAVPVVGQQVWVLYEGGDLSYPVYLPPDPAPPISVVRDWTEVSLASGFTANGNSNGVPAYRVLNILGAVRVEWKGGVGITYDSGSNIINAGFFLATPLDIVPANLRTIPAACSAQSSSVNSLKIDFQVDGTAKIVGTNTTTINPPWVSLNHVEYYL
jgi:hypothetical protein